MKPESPLPPIGSPSRRRRRPVAIAIAGALLATSALAVAPVAAAATLDQTPWKTSFDAVADPSGFLTSTNLGQNENFSGQSFSKGSLSGLVTAVTSSSEPFAGEKAVKLNDGDPQTKWLGRLEPDVWVRYELSEAKTATKYILALANDAPARNPKDWKVQGSTDGNDWTTLDTRTNQLDANGGAPSYFTRHEYKIPAAQQQAYKYYRLNITAVHNTDAAQIGEFELVDESGTTVYNQSNWNTSKSQGPRDSRVAKTNVGFTGLGALEYKGFNTSADRATGTNVLYEGLDLEIGATTELSYKIFPTLDEIDLDYSSTYVAVDLEYTDADGSNSRRMSAKAGLTDQYGYSVTAAAQGQAKTLYGRQWNAVRVDLSSLQGKRVKKVLLTYDNPDGSNASEAWGWIDDIQLAKAQTIDGSSLTNFVDTRRGSNSNGDFSRGNNYPATALPNGFNFYTPITEGQSDNDLYKYQQSSDGQNRPRLQGLGVSHEPSRWITDRNQFQFMPSLTTAATPNGGAVARELPFDRSKEVAQPDEYSVEFLNGIKAEIAPADHSAIFKFSYPTSSPTATIFLDQIEGSTPAGFTINNDGTFQGFSDGKTAGATRMFIYGQFEQGVGKIIPTSSGPATGRDHVVFAKFTNNGNPIEVRFATSLISTSQAQSNFAQELNGKSFGDIATAAQQAWDTRLSVIDVTGSKMTDKVNLYSNLYRLNLFPNSAFENTGQGSKDGYQYASPVNAASGSNSATQTGAKINDGKIFVNNGFWDTYRTAWPLYNYLYPDVAAELIDGFVEQSRAGGWIARWSAPGYDNQMTGTSSDASFADAYIAGALSTPLAEEAYAAALKNATALPASNVAANGNYTEERVGRKSLATAPFLGFTPAAQDQSVSWGLEGLINDYAIGKMAKKLSTDVAVSATKRARYAEEASYFLTRAEGYVNLFDPEVGDPADADTPLGFFTARKANGDWLLKPGAYNLGNRSTIYNPEDWDAGNGTEVNNHTYTETNGWNFAFHAPYDVDGLAALYGGKDGLVAKLDTFFDTPEKADTRKIHETYEARDVRMGQWGASNQVSFHIPYLYAAAGKPSGTQKVIREAMQRLFVGSEIGQGYPGDEDNGALGSWYIYSALGMYPLAVGSGQYVIGSPIFDSATIKPLGTSDSLTINAPNNSTKNIYIQSATLDGQALNTATVDQNKLTKGQHTLNLNMGSSASTWGEHSLAAAAPAPAIDVANPQYSSVSAPGTADAARLVDDNSTTVATLAAEQATISITPLTGLAKVSEYTITNGATGADPKAWKLEGRKVDGSWVSLDERADESFAWRSQIRPFTVSTPATYTAYRLQITKTSNGQGASIGEIELLATEAGESGTGGLTITAKPEFTTPVGTEFKSILAGIGGVASGETVTATIDYGTGPVAANVLSVPTGGRGVVADHTFDVPGLYDLTVKATHGSETVTTSVQVRVTLDRSTADSVARNADVACFSDLGTAADCDGNGFAYDKAKVKAQGIQFGVEQSVVIDGKTFYYTLPDVESGKPDTLTARGQLIDATLNPGATHFSVLGMANSGQQAMRVWLVFEDGSEQEVTVRFGDWGGDALNPISNNTLVFNAPGRLWGTTAETNSATDAAVFAIAPQEIQTDGNGKPKTLKQIRVESQGSALVDGRTHMVAFASNGSPVETLTVTAPTNDVITTRAGVAITPNLATVTGGRADRTATVNWGDKSGIANVSIGNDGSVTAGHAYAAAGTYQVTVVVADGEKSKTVVRTVKVVEPAATTTSLAASTVNVASGGSVTLTAQVAPAAATGTVEFFDAGASIGSVQLAQGAASKTISGLATGVYTFTAGYSGDAGNLASTSQAVTVVVAAPPVVKVTVSAPKFSASSQVYNATASKRGKVSVVVTDATSGTVTFKSGSKTLGKAPIVKKGSSYIATLTLPAKLAVGSYQGVTASLSASGKTVTSPKAPATFKVVKAKTKKVTVQGKSFKKGTKPKVTVQIAKLSNGQWATGKVQVRVGSKVVRTVKISAKKKGKISIALPKRYSSSIKVSAKFVPSSTKTVSAKTSKRVTVKALR